MSYYSNNMYPNYQYTSPYTTQPTMPALQGKIVDSADMVKVTEVPFGGFAVFPKGDMSEIYVKNWSSNGTTQIITYKPVIPEQKIETKTVDIHIVIISSKRMAPIH